MYLKRVYKASVLRRLRKGTVWIGYLAGHSIAVEQIGKVGHKVAAHTVAELEQARRDVLLCCDPDTGFRIAYYEQVATPMQPRRGHRALW